ncbi:hypothetical protein G8759_20130 [Spirosoma aureum]|uniref:Uncharacterized protein n=1 Tax=Spirosoma aureum TaxID=2692134 RepID=A0A6G9AQJ8_9BACT|nr:ABC transporter C-terminal domain-containing protein [Spirosoma aureum]QIP14761.1 hypothetical protein G8759_20130 [Spirosoma aureum]
MGFFCYFCDAEFIYSKGRHRQQTGGAVPPYPFDCNSPDSFSTLGRELSSGSGSTACLLLVAITVMPKLSQTEIDRRKLERLEARILILRSKIEQLQQGLNTSIAQAQKLSSSLANQQ